VEVRVLSRPPKAKLLELLYPLRYNYFMKNALVTGASRGIGREVTIELSKKGYFVFLTGRDKSALEETKNIIDENGGSSEIIILDLLNPESIKSVSKLVKEKIKVLDVLANIAGMYHDDKIHFFGIPFENYPDDAIIKNINASLVGHVLLTKHLVEIMGQDSCVINMSGTFDEEETGVISDFITKKANELFSKQLSLELKDRGVRSNCIRPDFVFTDNVQKFFPDVKKEEALDPKYVAQRIVEVCEDPNMNGEIIEINK